LEMPREIAMRECLTGNPGRSPVELPITRNG
jgi:hypothetical protein